MAWARRHEFERHFQQAKAERARVADIQEDYLKRSFAAILLRHQDTLFDLDDEVAKGSAGAEGRLRKAELAKAQVEEKRERRLEETRRGRNVRRGQVRVLATARLLPAALARRLRGGSGAERSTPAPRSSRSPWRRRRGTSARSAAPTS